ncbi:TPA: imidazole glycerol phosphate synthase subunit HisF [Candidatus Bathyarchaeota archaeon]|nr:imidazole glycerol phosphate synthase subunit HisF [Candidatus Bathyarchaeota archaeon]
MFLPRVIPILLLKDLGLVKTIQFENPRYIGDPINAVKIFNVKEVNEIAFLDITATKSHIINYDMIRKISQECMTPLTYGGGVTKLDDIGRLFKIGIEKVAINTAAFNNPRIITDASEAYGSQSVIASIDVKKHAKGSYEVVVGNGSTPTGADPVSYARKMESLGAGEILLTSIDRDGTMTGYDIELIRSVSDAVKVPVIASGGAGKLQDLRSAYLNGKASALAAGSIFVFFGKKKAVLITYPDRDELETLLAQ